MCIRDRPEPAPQPEQSGMEAAPAPSPLLGKTQVSVDEVLSLIHI